MGNQSIAQPTLRYVTFHAATRKSKRLAQQAAAGTAPLSITTQLGKRVASKTSKVSPSDCVRPPEGATNDSSLILMSLDRTLFNLVDMGRSLTELQKSSKFLWKLSYLLSISPLSLSIEVTNMRVVTCPAPLF
jgi:hypothetical protein